MLNTKSQDQDQEYDFWIMFGEPDVCPLCDSLMKSQKKIENLDLLVCQSCGGAIRLVEWIETGDCYEGNIHLEERIIVGKISTKNLFYPSDLKHAMGATMPDLKKLIFLSYKEKHQMNYRYLGGSFDEDFLTLNFFDTEFDCKITIEAPINHLEELIR